MFTFAILTGLNIFLGPNHHILHISGWDAEMDGLVNPTDIQRLEMHQEREGGNGGYDIYTFELPEDIRSDSANYLATVDVVELAPGDAVVLQNIQFEYNSSALTEDSQQGIQMLTNFLQRNPNLKVELAGHTDNVGSESYNLKLSSERADSVRNALISNGIDGSRLTAKGYGASRPVVPNDTDEHRALNRRTEMIVID